MNLKDRVALVTGSGRGIGKTIALKLAELGADVVINDFGDSAPAEATAQEVRSLGRKSLVAMADVSSTPDVERMFETALAAFGKIDILVNNAGITQDKLLLRMSDEEWDRVININLKSAFLCTRAVLRPMTKQRWGRIISISSIVGIVGNKGQANYSASKAGIIGLTRTVAKEVASRGITANAIAPGFIATPMTEKLSPEWKEELFKVIPLGTFGTPQDVAETAAFLASEGARYITGQVISVDGGLTVSWL